MKKKVKEMLEQLGLNDPNIITDELIAKIADMVDTAATAKASKMREEITEEVVNEKKEELSTLHEEMVTKVESHLKTVSEEWLEANKDKLKDVAKLKALEEFHGKLMAVVSESKMEVKEGENTEVEDLKAKVEELKEEVNDAAKKTLKLEDDVLRSEAEKAFLEETLDLSDQEKEELKELVGDVEFQSAESFREKVKIMRDQFLKTKETVSEGDTDDAEGDTDDADVAQDEDVEQIVSYL